jgi:SAM-dependent methyltransferase
MFHPSGPTLLELARQGLSSTERGYDLLAPKFDFTPFRTPDAIVDAVGEHLRPLAPFGSALDLCCGTGVGVRMLRPLCCERVVGLDFSEGMLAEARRRLGEAPRSTGGARVEWKRADALDLAYRDEIDVVTCFGAFGHIPRHEEERFVAGIFRALRPGGRFVFATAHRPRPLSPAWIVGRGYNGLAHLRNLLVRPRFVMFYLTFLLEDASRLLEAAGFEFECFEGRFPPPWRRGVLVEARKPAGATTGRTGLRPK